MKLSKYMYGPIAVASVVATPLAALAQDVGGTGVGSVNPATGDTDLGTVIDSILGIVFWVATLLAIIYLVMSGISYITAGGDSEKADGARKGIVNAIIGLVIIALAYVIVGAVTGSVGGTNTNLFDPSNGSGGGGNLTQPVARPTR